MAGLAVSLLGVALIVPTGGASASSNLPVRFTQVTVTAAAAKGSSAVAMSIANGYEGPISLMLVTSSVSRMNMIYYDSNMCQGTNMMSWLPNILISSHSTQLLGYQNQGAMLGQLTRSLKVGESITLEVKYSNFSAARTVSVTAKVVAPPKGLHFLMSPMRM